MIKIYVSKDKIEVMGHAKHSEYGKDIVCAAVSSCVLTTVNAILELDKSYISVNDNDGITIEILKHDNIVDKLIINMINMLDELEKEYSKNIKIYREV
ncbi:MAG: ribosomal-processing cysteine protease Prp [Bacilli bacterium]|nr:ribosomal-processing cysteine protease Prp [Bacilli bacterium]